MVDSVGGQTASRDKLGKGINGRNVKSRRLGQDALPVRNGQNVRIAIRASPRSATAANAPSISAGSLTGLTVSSTPKTVAAASIDCIYTPPLAPALGWRIKQHRDLFAILPQVLGGSARRILRAPSRTRDRVRDQPTGRRSGLGGHRSRHPLRSVRPIEPGLTQTDGGADPDGRIAALCQTVWQAKASSK